MKTPSLTITSLSLIIISIVFGIILSSSFVSADDAVDEVEIDVPISCAMSGTGLASHTTTISNGQFDSSVGETTLKAFCNDREGFAIYAVGFTDDEEGNNVLTDSTLGSTHDIVTGTVTSGDVSNWAMKLSTVSNPVPTYPIVIAGTTADTLKEQGDLDYSLFQEVPSNYTKVAYHASNTDIGNNAEGSTLKTTYQVYISQTQTAGTYEGQVKYTLVHPSSNCVSYTIHFDPGAGSGTMDDQVICAGIPTALAAGTFTPPAGSDLIGWSTESDGTGKLYNNEQILINEANSGETINLYARYGTSFDMAYAAAGKSKYNNTDYYAMQDMSSTICSNATVNQETRLVDSRDGKVYYIAKLADDNCWMVQNLDHDMDDDFDYNRNNTDLQDDYYYEFSEIYDTVDYIDSEVIYEEWPNAHSYNPGDLCWDGTIIQRLDNVYDHLTTCTDRHYHIGNGYDWSAAAMTDFFDISTDAEREGEDSDANRSICPANWMLPKDQILSADWYSRTLNHVSGTMTYLFDQLNLTNGPSGTAHLAPVYLLSTNYQSSIIPTSWDTLSTSFYVDGDISNGHIVAETYPAWYYQVRCVAR